VIGPNATARYSSSIEPVRVKVNGVALEIGSGDKSRLTLAAKSWKLQFGGPQNRVENK
jgi:hypothetical protein